MNDGPRFAIVVPAGPGQLQMDRIADLLDAMAQFEPGVLRVIIVDDEPGAVRDFVEIAGPLGDRVTVVMNPRDRGAEGWSEGVLVATATGIREARAGSPAVDWVLRIDTDAQVIGPFADAIDERFRADPLLGQIGSYRWEADGTPRDVSRPARPLRRLRAPISVWKQQRRVRTSLFGVGRERRQLILDAEQHGYQLGEHCQGGAYALSMPAMDAIAARGWLDCRLWLGTFVAEDSVVSLWVKALGLNVLGMSNPGEPFAVRHIGLPRPAEELVALSFGIAHSLKDHDGVTEDELREVFRRLRQTDGAPGVPQSREA